MVVYTLRSVREGWSEQVRLHSLLKGSSRCVPVQSLRDGTLESGAGRTEASVTRGAKCWREELKEDQSRVNELGKYERMRLDRWEGAKPFRNKDKMENIKHHTKLDRDPVYVLTSPS